VERDKFVCPMMCDETVFMIGTIYCCDAQRQSQTATVERVHLVCSLYEHGSPRLPPWRG